MGSLFCEAAMKMQYTGAAVVLVGLIAVTSSARKWEKLSTTFGVYRSTPMTEAEAIQAGWNKVSSCADGGKFAGNRYIEPFGHSFLIIYDEAGYIAGTQTMARTLYIDADLVDFSAHPAYQLDFLGDWEAYFATAYFVDPAIICSGGRTAEEFEIQGVGDRLAIQVGETAEMVYTIPMTESEVDTEMWFVHKCLAGMGRHIIGYNYQPDQDCDSVMPVQILYHQGELSGFVWQHQADLPQDPNTAYWEKPSKLALTAIVTDPPQCLLDHISEPGLSTLHHYFLNNPWNAIC